jgi:hypothetical protein
VSRLTGGAATVNELAEQLDIALRAISMRIKVLGQAGWWSAPAGRSTAAARPMPYANATSGPGPGVPPGLVGRLHLDG